MTKPQSNDEYRIYLEQLGLTLKAADVYLCLLNSGRLTAGTLMELTGYKRGDLHYLLDQLTDRGLIKQTRQKNKDIFQVESPWRLQELWNQQEKKLRLQQQNLQALLPQLVSQYTLSTKQPVIRHLEGISGIKILYDEILHDKHDLSIFSAQHDRDIPELNNVINRAISRQKKSGIKTRALISLFPELDHSYFDYCQKNNIENRIIPPEKFQTESQIIVFGNKVALSSIGAKIITTIIENHSIAQTCQTIFDLLWELSRPWQSHLLNQIPRRSRLGFSRYLDKKD